MRSTAALGGGGLAFWRNGSTLQVAPQAGDGGGGAWGPPDTLTGSNDAGVGNEDRSFATCALSSDVARVLYWDGARLRFRKIDYLGNRSMEPDLGTPGNARPMELVLVCGANRAHAFGVFPDDPNAIVGTSFDENKGWSPWVTVVDPKTVTPGTTRCWLTGFDRVSPGLSLVENTAGLAWTESSDCTSAVPAELVAAFVRVYDG
jgi:hypothetical protein